LTAAAAAADRERGAAQSDDVMQRADDDTAALYAELNRQVLAGAAAAELKGVGVEHTNETILHALTAATPRTRYIVGAKVCVCAWVRGYCALWKCRSLHVCVLGSGDECGTACVGHGRERL